VANHLSIVLTGFSVISILVLLFVYLFFLPDMRKTIMSKFTCAVTLLSLALIQFAHYLHFIQNINLLDMRFYCVLLSIIPTFFFFFGREILFPDVRYRWFDSFHLTPITLSLLLPINILPIVAFTFGTSYTFWFAMAIYKLKYESRRFKFEIFCFGFFAVMALFGLILGLCLPVLDHGVFYSSYSNSISIAILLIVVALLAFPELLSDILLIAELAYAKTKLQGVDTQKMKEDLDQLMVKEKIYENEDLNLSMVANSLSLSTHQLSELINTEYGYSFPRFVREHRIKAAKILLMDSVDVSILSISMETGFKSQSSFYTAFKELTGVSPGKFRQQ
jgi:AraC-like DNA-binding protein